MKNKIISIISDYINNSNDGKFDFTNGKSGYEQPLFGFASINDPIFVEYKSNCLSASVKLIALQCCQPLLVQLR
jgi:hypothetical protein